MAYVDQKTPADQKKAAVGVVLIHAAIGTVLVTGLATTFIPAEPPAPFEGSTILPLEPPPPPKPVEEPKPAAAASTPDAFTPKQPITITPYEPIISTTTTLDPLDGPILNSVTPPGTGTIPATLLPPLKPKFDPISAQPRNRPSEWITQSDYRTSWINREYTGVARFTLSVGSDGKVDNCQIVASSGHAVLDEATCALAQRRARFEPARGSDGSKVSGSYTTSVKWELPD